jgi:hypothetical protein
LIALPYRAPVRPNPPALTTKRVHATCLFGALCQHSPAGSARALSSLLIALLWKRRLVLRWTKRCPGRAGDSAEPYSSGKISPEKKSRQA